MSSQHDRMFGEMSPTRLFVRCAIPNMISMAVVSLYTIADGMFVGHYIGAQALAAVNLVWPLIMMSFALVDMVAVGSSVHIAIRLGEKKGEEASRIFTTACMLIMGISVLAGVTAWCFAPQLVVALGAEGEVAALAVEYMRVYAAFSPLIMIFFAVDNYLRICGKVTYSMAMNVAVSLANIVLDAWFIAVLGWGIGAAALASCLCLATGTVVCFFPFVCKRMPLRFVRGGVPLPLLGHMLANGSSEFFSNISSSVCMMMFNAVLMEMEGYLAVAAFSIVMYVDSIVKCLWFGMADALQPAISYNYGAGSMRRVFALEYRVQLAALGLSVLVLVGMQISGPALVRLFAPEQELVEMGTHAMRLFALSYLVSWCGVVSGSFLTALGRPGASLLLAMSQTLLLPALCLILLPAKMGLDGVWLTPLAAGLLSTALAVVILGRVVRTLRRGCAQS